MVEEKALKGGSVASDMADLSIERRPADIGLVRFDAFERAIVRAAIEAAGISAETHLIVSRLNAMVLNAARMQEAVEQETAAMFAATHISRRNRKVLNSHEREKPTRERASRGEFELLNAQTIDTTRDGERILMDWRARAGGAGEMHVRGQISARELAAAVKVCELAEYASSGLVGGGQFQEGVDGGGGGDAGARLVSAAWASGQYRAALERLTKAGRFLVEQRVVLARPMEEVVRLKGAAYRLGEVTVRKRCERAVVVLTEALDGLADIFGLGG